MSKESLLQALQEVGTLPAPTPVPYKNQTFYVRRLNGEARTELSKRIAYLASISQDMTDADYAAIALCTEAGEPMFESIPEGVAFLSPLDGDLQKLFAEKMFEVNGLSDLPVTEANEKKS